MISLGKIWGAVWLPWSCTDTLEARIPYGIQALYGIIVLLSDTSADTLADI